MASNRIRALRNVSNRLTRVQARLGYLDRRPAPRRLADNFIFTNNIQRVAIVEPLVAPDAITNEKLTDDAVGTDEIQLDAMTGKNINSCTITDSSFSNGDISDSSMANITADGVTGTNFDVIQGTDWDVDGIVITNGEITETTLDGAGVVLTECTLANCTADTITATAGSLALVGNPVAVSGGFAVVDGGTTMTVASGAFGVGTGGGTLQIGGGSAEFSGFGWESFAVSGENFVPLDIYLDEVDALYQAISDLESQLASKADASHSHPGL